MSRIHNRTKCGVTWLARNDDQRSPKIVFTNMKIFVWNRRISHCWSLSKNQSFSKTGFISFCSQTTMKAFFAAIALVFFTAPLANSSVKPTPNSNQMRKAQCHINYNNNFYAGPNCKKIEQQLAEIKNDIRAVKRNETREKTVKGL